VENRQAAAEIQLQQEKLNTTKKNGNNLLWGKLGFKTLNGAKAVKEEVEAEKDKLYMLYNGYRSLPKIEDERRASGRLLKRRALVLVGVGPLPSIVLPAA